MYIVAGLGNPTSLYEKTRHNAGFESVEVLADKLGISMKEKKHKALCGSGMVGLEKIILAKPQTFMNLSGESIRAISVFYKVEPEHIIIIYDDIDLEEGKLRLRAKGSAGGHNGIKSIIAHLGTQEFPRIRVGIGHKPEGMDLADYVLEKFPKGQKDVMKQAFEDAADAAVLMIEEGVDAAMNRYNRKK